jgi:hypothetical protein
MADAPTEIDELLAALVDGEVEFILVGYCSTTHRPLDQCAAL